MTQTDLALQPLFTGENGIDDKLRQAYVLGVRQGQREPLPDYLIQQRVKLAASIMRHFHCSAEEALIALGVPKAERKPVLKNLETQQKQKEKWCKCR